MLNGDDILELADETGYRLCNFALPDAIPSEQKVFSVTWDQNNHHRLFICLQDGQLKSVDVKTHESKDYHVRFRRFLANEETMTNNDEKIIQHHWDKMTTIPGRPDELIFLLGFSKTVVYTALPKSVDASEENSPVISAYSRDDLPGYIYGVPIMQITQHTGRITALDINQNHGNILASGDEYGSVRLLLLQHIDKSHFFTQPLLGTSQPNQTNQILAKYPFLPSYNVSFQAHEGSIFSLAWFPLHGKTLENGVTTFGLVTGSTDRVVKIWQISFNNTQGFHIEPCLQLNTLSTQILCLNAFSPISSDEHNHCVYISAGTNLGTVHIWKLSSDETYDILHPNPLANEIQNISNDFEFQSSHKQHIDTGNYLIALIQASDKPIMHIQCTLSTSKFRKRNSTHGELLLSFFDTGSCLYLYSSEIYTNDPTNNNNNNLENEFSLEDNVQLEGIRNKYMKSIQLNNVDRLLYSMDYTEKETFVPIKDETFLESQIVASGFSYASEGELMVCTMNGQLQFFNDFNTPTPTNTPQKLMKSPLREPMHSSIKVDSLKTFLNLEDEQEDEDIDPRNNNNSRLQLTIPADSPISPLKKNSTNEQTLNKTPTTNNNIKTPTNFSAKNQVNQSDELEPKPRMTTPQPTPTKSPSSNTSKRFLQPTLSHSMKQETSSSKQQQQTSTMISKKNLSSLNTIQTSSTNRAKANDDDQRSVSNESYTSVSSNATGATNINYMAKLKEFQSYREDLEPSPYINNPLAEPTLHTVKVQPFFILLSLMNPFILIYFIIYICIYFIFL